MVVQGQLTVHIYNLIRGGEFPHAIKVLEMQLVNFPENHAALSLLGYCHYMAGDFHASTSKYEELSRLHPRVEKYRMYHAQALYKAGMHAEAARACSSVEGHQKHIQNLRSSILLEQGDIAGSHLVLEQCAEDNIDGLINLGSCLYKKGNYSGAHAKFTQAMLLLGFQPDLAYNRALCLYRMKFYDAAAKILMEIVELGSREHPELSIGSHVEGMELRSVGNSQTLKESALVEAFNLKAAIEFIQGNIKGAQEALDDMPPRAEEELDCVRPKLFPKKWN